MREGTNPYENWRRFSHWARIVDAIQVLSGSLLRMRHRGTKAVLFACGLLSTHELAERLLLLVSCLVGVENRERGRRHQHAPEGPYDA